MTTCPVCQGSDAITAAARGYSRCARCDCYVLEPAPTPEQLARHYSAMFAAGNYQVSRDHGETTRNKFQRLVRDYLAEYPRHGRPAPRHVLDIGCFTGEFLDAAAAAGLETCGFETMPEAMAAAGRRHRVWGGDLRTAASPTMAVDMITLNDVLEHVLDVRTCVEFVREHLTPSVLVFLTTPDVHSWAGRILGTSWGVFDGREHVALYSRAAVQRLLEAAALEVVAIRPHWKRLSLGYVWHMAWHWQAKGRAVSLPRSLQRIPVTINVGEMLVVAAGR